MLSFVISSKFLVCNWKNVSSEHSEFGHIKLGDLIKIINPYKVMEEVSKKHMLLPSSNSKGATVRSLSVVGTFSKGPIS